MRFLHADHHPIQRIFLVVLLMPTLLASQPLATAAEQPRSPETKVPAAVCSVPDYRVLFESLPTKPVQERSALPLSYEEILVAIPSVSVKTETPFLMSVEKLPSSYLLLNVIAASFL